MHNVQLRLHDTAVRDIVHYTADTDGVTQLAGYSLEYWRHDVTKGPPLTNHVLCHTVISCSTL